MLLLLAFVLMAAAKLPRDLYNDDLLACPRDRNEAIDCILKYGDANHDRKINEQEIRILKDGLLYWYEKWFDELHPNNEIMEKCDADDDDAVDEEDFDKTLDTCLSQCSGVMDLMIRICDRAVATKYKPPRLAPVKKQ